ncbi:hypothetical protein [Chroococcidiopsis sp.]|uniref:hypothetical protein n=1 Tax=Chroococcidiopsis sp. TaxID=3088168 RepID=UPI003F2F71B7
MLLILLLVGFLLIITIFAIALVWDYTRGIFSFHNTTSATAIDASPNDPEQYPEQYVLSQPIEHPTA